VENGILRKYDREKTDLLNCFCLFLCNNNENMKKMKFLAISLNPAIDYIIYCDHFKSYSKNIVMETSQFPAGKGRNVALALRKFSQKVSLLEILGKENVNVFKKDSLKFGIDSIFFCVDGYTRTNIKIIDGNKGKDTELNERGFSLDQGESQRILDFLAKHASDFGFVCISGSLPAGMEDNFYHQVVELVNSAGSRCALDTSGLPLQKGIAAAPAVLHVNRFELGELLGNSFRSNNEVYEATQHLIRMGICLVVVSMGREGALANNGRCSWLARPPEVIVRNTIGAGDVMLASIMYDFIKSTPLDILIKNATALATASTIELNLRDMEIKQADDIARNTKLSQIK